MLMRIFNMFDEVWHAFSNVTGLFFIGLFILLPLGDGKQTLTDVVALALTLLVGSLFWRKRPAVQLRQQLLISWLFLFGVLMIASFQSLSFSFSLSELFRYSSAFLLFGIFYTVSDHKQISLFSKNTIYFVVAASIVALFFILNRSLGLRLPPLNLLYAFHGHNFLAGLLLIAFPLLLPYIGGNKWTWYKSGFWFLLGSLLITFSRGALGILLLYLLYKIVIGQSKELKSRLLLVSITLACTLFILGLGLLKSLPIINLPLVNGYWLKTQLNKVDLVTNYRVQYWQQAWAGFTQRPLLGNGPGTFSLVSKAFQLRPESYSVHAHSFLLQLLAELGLIGAFAVIGLIVISLRPVLHLKQTGLVTNPSVLPLLEALLLTLGYSLIEFNLQFWVIWLWFWAVLGLIAGSQKNSSKLTNLPILQTVFKTTFGINVIGYLTYGLLYILPFEALIKLPFPLYLVDKISTLKTIQLLPSHTSMSFKQAAPFLFFYPHDSDVLSIVADKFTFPNQFESAHSLYQKALGLDPKNAHKIKLYLDRIETLNKPKVLYEEFLFCINLYASTSQRDFLAQLNMEQTSTTLSPHISPVLKTKSNATSFDQEIAQRLYNLGLTQIDTNPHLAAQLWEAAIPFYQTLSYHYIDLASLYYYKLNNPQQALKTLLRCAEQPQAKAHCQEFFVNDAVHNLPRTGFFAEDIWLFPHNNTKGLK